MQNVIDLIIDVKIILLNLINKKLLEKFIDYTLYFNFTILIIIF